MSDSGAAVEVGGGLIAGGIILLLFANAAVPLNVLNLAAVGTIAVVGGIVVITVAIVVAAAVLIGGQR